MTKIDFVSLLLPRHVKLSKKEHKLLETKIFFSFYTHVLENLKLRYKEYLMKLRVNYHDKSISSPSFVQEILNDILTSGEYSLYGISIYTHIPEDVLFEIATGINKNPTINTVAKLLELHITVKKDSYNEVIKKILTS